MHKIEKMPSCCDASCIKTVIEIQPMTGDSVCINCGVIWDDTNIVNEVQFEQNASGGSSAIGKFIHADDSYYNGSSIATPKSRDLTIANARRKIKETLTILRFPHNSLVDTCVNFYKLSLNKNLTKGRKFEMLIGACVYITCRTELAVSISDSEKMPMLIDISDALQIDVYKLGRTYLKLTKDLCIAVPLMDPCFYILRFSSTLVRGRVDNKTLMLITETATRLVKRMKKDWMTHGRRPSGICGAALVIAARLYNLNVTLNDAIKVVKVHESTLRKRLSEFARTKTSFLTVDEFMTEDLPDEEDPPAFKAARIKEQQLKVQSLLDQDTNINCELKEIHKEIQKELEHRRSKLSKKYGKEQTKPDNNSLKRTLNNDYESDDSVHEIECTQSFITESTLKTISECLLEVQDPNVDKHVPDIGIRPSAASLGLKHSIEDCMKIIPNVTDPVVEDTGILDLTGIDEDEIDSYIMSEREISTKTCMWMELNKEYLEEQKLKEEREKKEADQREKDGIPLKKKRTYVRRQKKTGPASSAGEAIENLIQEKNLSSKINYDILKNLKEPENNERPKNPEMFNLSTSKVSKKDPIKTPAEIHSIVQALAGNRPQIISPKETEKISTIQQLQTENQKEESGDEAYDDDDDEDDDDDDEEEEDAFSLLEKRRQDTELFYR